MPLKRSTLRGGSSSFWWCAVATIAFLFPMQSSADDGKTQALSHELATMLRHRNETTKVEFNECTLQIKRRVRTTCRYPTEPNWAHTTLKLGEIKSFELNSFREWSVLSVNLDIPEPSYLQTQLNQYLMGRDAAFEIFMKESDRLFKESNVASNETIISCTGTNSVTKRRSHMLFLDAVPESIDHFQVLIDQCRR